MTRAWLPAALLVVAFGVAPRSVFSEEPKGYPLPDDIAAVIASEEEAALRDVAMAALEPEDGAVKDLDWPRRLLLLLGDVGLRAACERLAAGDVPKRLEPHLVRIVAASAHPDADKILAVAARQERPLLRMIAAHGLGKGRSADAVPILADLARDARSGVRAAALASLFALDSPQAVEARRALAVDAEPKLLQRRLEWHRRARDASPALRDLAIDLYHHGHSPAVRMEAAHLLSDAALDAPPEILWRVLLETGTGLLGEWLVRFGLDAPKVGYDLVKMRHVAIDAALTFLVDEDAPADQRAKVLELAIGWIAEPVAMDPYRRDPIPELELRRRLPDLGPSIVAPVVARLRAGTFDEPSHGVVLIRELGDDVAVPVMVDLLDADPASFADRARGFMRDVTEGDAADALRRFGRVGGETIARRLLASDLDTSVKEDLLLALHKEDAAWVVPLLEEHLETERMAKHGVMSRDKEDLRRAARKALMGRIADPKARDILIADLFATADDPPRWLGPLAEPFGELGWSILARALDDRRPLFQRVALSVLAEKATRHERGAALVRAFIPTTFGKDILHKALTALVNQAPLEAVTFVRENWDVKDAIPGKRRALEQLGGVRGAEASKATVDLALDVFATAKRADAFRASVGAALMGRWGHRRAEVERFWRESLRHDTDDFVSQAVAAMNHPRVSVMTDLLVPLFERALREDALDDAEDIGAESEAALGQAILTAFEHQPWGDVERVVIDACFDPVANPELRAKAARLLVARVTNAGRERLLRWLTGQSSVPGAKAEKPVGANAEGFLQQMIAMAIGIGGGERAAGALYATLDRELRSYYSVDARLDPDTPRTYPLAPRVSALAHGIVRTRHEPSIRGLVDMLFRPEFGQYAATAARRQRALVRPGGLDAPLDAASPLEELKHEVAGLYRVLPPEAEAIVSHVAAARDDVLARAFTDTLSRAGRDGAIAMFPDLYLLKVSQALRDGRDHERRPRAAEVVETVAASLAPAGSVADYAMASNQVVAHVRAGRFAHALDAQKRVVEIVSRRGYKDDEDVLWLREQARLDALRGMNYVQRKQGMLARDAFREALMRGPNDVGVLSIVAELRAAAHFDLDIAESSARRAVALESRSLTRPRLETVDVLVSVLLAKGKADEAIDLLLPRLEGPPTYRNARFFLHLAAAFVLAEDHDNAELALVKALTREPGLIEDALRDPEFEPLRAEGRVDRARARARAARREEL